MRGKRAHRRVAVPAGVAWPFDIRRIASVDEFVAGGFVGWEPGLDRSRLSLPALSQGDYREIAALGWSVNGPRQRDSVQL